MKLQTLRRPACALLLLASGNCTEPRHPLSGEFRIEAVLTTHTHRSSGPCYVTYCYQTDPINENASGWLSVPAQSGDASSPVLGVTISVAGSDFPNQGTASMAAGKWTSRAERGQAGWWNPSVTLDGTFYGDSIVGSISMRFGSSPATSAEKRGTFRAKRN